MTTGPYADSCPYYCPGQPTEEDAVACCRHKHAPAPFGCFVAGTETALSLSCEGHVSKCQIPARERLDVS